MTELDRREVITGLAAVAVAGLVLPVLPDGFAQYVRTGLAFTPHDAEADADVKNIIRIFWESRWHVHIHSPTEQTFRHLDSGGQTFATDPRNPENLWPVRRVRSERHLVNHLGIIAYPALYCQPRACMMHGMRLLDGHEGAFYLYASEPYDRDAPLPRLVTEDAPSLPRFA